MRGLARFAILAATSVAAAQPPAATTRRIIDVHMHAESQDPRFGSPPFNNLLTGETVTASVDEASHIAACLALMQRLNIARAVVSGGEHHEAVLRWKQRAPEKVLVGYGFDDPARLDAAFLRREHAAGRLQVLGEVGTQYAGVAPNDPRMEPIYALAEELDVPLGLHLHPGPPGAAYPPFGMTKMRAANGRPLLLEEALLRHPGLRLYVMHAGWPFLDETIALLYAHPQVYVELGVIDWSQPRAEFHRYLRGLVDAGYGKRVMFGSDQMVWPGTIEMAVRNVEAASYLTESQKDDIFYGNAVRFLRLEKAGTP
jgi:predicted TIM-barrel fold metal-dependent hydrolase